MCPDPFVERDSTGFTTEPTKLGGLDDNSPAVVPDRNNTGYDPPDNVGISMYPLYVR
jgi:hypothetical protein